MDDAPYHPRPNDHLVEPFFQGLGEGLGHRAPEPAGPELDGPRTGSWLGRLVARLLGRRGTDGAEG